MSEHMDKLAGVWGFISGILTVGLVYYINYRIGKKKRRFDERYHQLHTKARSLAWGVSTICIVCAWLATLLVEGPGFSFFIVTFVYVAHMLAYLISSIVVEKKF